LPNGFKKRKRALDNNPQLKGRMTNRSALYIPKGFAHGFQTLMDDSELLYMIDVGYVADAARGVRWNDPSINVRWP
jgi:dTDP-4-dehydrorhamnose 3,5-epimerase-like enzyme